MKEYVGVFHTKIIKEQSIEVQPLHKVSITQNSQTKTEIINQESLQE